MKHRVYHIRYTRFLLERDFIAKRYCAILFLDAESIYSRTCLYMVSSSTLASPQLHILFPDFHISRFCNKLMPNLSRVPIGFRSRFFVWQQLMMISLAKKSGFPKKARDQRLWAHKKCGFHEITKFSVKLRHFYQRFPLLSDRNFLYGSR